MSAVQFCLIVDFMVIMPQGPQLMRSLDISAQEFGSLVSAYTLGAGLFSLLASFVIDRFDRKKTLIRLFIGFALCNLQSALATHFGTLLFVRFLTGAFAGVVGALIFSIVSDAIDIDRRASALGIVMSAFAVASIVGVPICLFLSNGFGWSAPFIFISFLTMVISFLIYLYLPKVVLPSEGRITGPVQVLESFRHLVTEKSRSLSLLFMSCLMLGHFSINPFLFPSVVSNAKVPESELPIIYLVGGFASIAASIFFGKASDKYGKKAVFSISLVASLAAIYFVTNLKPMSLGYIVAVVTSFFVLMGGRLTPATALVTATASPRNRGGLLSLVASVQQLSAGLGTYLAGLIVVKTADGELLNFKYVGFMAMAFSLMALALSKKITPLEGAKA